MPQPTLGRPLDEPYLRHQLRPHPLHLPHLKRSAERRAMSTRRTGARTATDQPSLLARIERAIYRLQNTHGLPLQPSRNIVAQRARLAARPKDAPLELKATGT